MTSRQFGLGRNRLFRRWLPSSTEVRFVAPDLNEIPWAEASSGAESIELAADRSLIREAARRPRDRFQPLPAPTGDAPYGMTLESVLAADDISQFRNSGKIVLHAVGDTGGVTNDHWQKRVVDCMVSDCHRADSSDNPAFFFHLGDVVYFRGEHENYFPQFYQAYEHYPAPIFAIPGNHDGERTNTSESLAAFVTNFCSSNPGNSTDAIDVVRDTMTQPNVYFTLDALYATFVGLYSNVPEGGVIQADQFAWFVDALRNAPDDRPIVVAVHHPLFSADDHHSGSPAILQAFRQAISDSGRFPDLVLTGHVHNYQRFTWEVQGRQIPVIVAGSGGYPNLHKVVSPGGRRLDLPHRPQGAEATLEAYVDRRHGFLRLEITAQRITGKYYAVPSDDSVVHGERMDRFIVDLNSHRLIV